jgi:hypothetical protein
MTVFLVEARTEDAVPVNGAMAAFSTLELAVNWSAKNNPMEWTEDPTATVWALLECAIDEEPPLNIRLLGVKRWKS